MQFLEANSRLYSSWSDHIGFEVKPALTVEALVRVFVRDGFDSASASRAAMSINVEFGGRMGIGEWICEQNCFVNSLFLKARK